MLTSYKGNICCIIRKHWWTDFCLRFKPYTLSSHLFVIIKTSTGRHQSSLLVVLLLCKLVHIMIIADILDVKKTTNLSMLSIYWTVHILNKNQTEINIKWQIYATGQRNNPRLGEFWSYMFPIHRLRFTVFRHPSRRIVVNVKVGNWIIYEWITCTGQHWDHTTNLVVDDLGSDRWF